MLHPAAVCQQLGDAAWGRYWGDFGGYEYGPEYSGFWLSVDMAETGGWSGWQPTNGIVVVRPPFTNGAASAEYIGGLLGHEELHHQGWKHGLVMPLPYGGILRHDDFLATVQNGCSQV
jgi:hypothetical protein